MNCPECGHEFPESCPLKVKSKHAAEVQEANWSSRKGVADADATVDGDEFSVRLEIERDAYRTYNFFKNRRNFEAMEHIDVHDVKSGEVEVRLPVEENRVITAWRCQKCGELYDGKVEVDLNYAEPVGFA